MTNRERNRKLKRMKVLEHQLSLLTTADKSLFEAQHLKGGAKLTLVMASKVLIWDEQKNIENSLACIRDDLGIEVSE